MSYDVYTGILKMMDDFQSMNFHVAFKYSYDESVSEKLKSKYNIDKISGTGNTLSKAINLLEWISNHIYHVGDYDNHITNNALELLNYSYDRGLEHGINCRSLSIALAECYLAVGIKARAVYLLPLSPYDHDSHVVCEVYIPENSKWIMVDPTYNGYVMDENNNILSVLGLRHALADRAQLKFCDKFNYNGDYNINFEDVKEYYAKNLFYLKCREIHNYNSEQLDDNHIIILAPKGYDVKKSMIANIEYRIEISGHGEWIKNKKNSIDKDVLIFAGEDELKKAPL